MDPGEIVVGFYGGVAFLVFVGVFVKFVLENISQTFFSTWEKCCLVLPWLCVAGAIGLCWIFIAIIVLVRFQNESSKIAFSKKQEVKA